MPFFSALKNILILLIFLQLAPLLVMGIKRQYERYVEPRAHVGLLPIYGTLQDSSWYVQQLTRLFKDTDIKAIVLRIDSSSSVPGTEELIYREIKYLKKEYSKPIVALVENVCISGAYLIASATDYIIAPGMSLIGNIGASSAYIFQLKDYVEQWEHADSSNDEARAITNDNVVDISAENNGVLYDVQNDAYQQSIEEVANARKLSIAKSTEWAEGKIFTGRQALALGLIDEIGSESSLLAIIKKKALIDDDIEWICASQAKSILSWLTSHIDSGAKTSSSTTEVLTSASDVLEKVLKVGTLVV